eukprot:CAMPEP_0198199300 /NCGR_PEP_ID=MMETSP1445-20131203/2612_1 /TAXON_ID=36898 /ORGANISM="Pyramimonas sp., Strain CCMP2087" /LENGTH=310 /DNA_ID=CAMNT_0043869105 /DNA_START=453 /DNA_END=1383 /DNA_ORIENTATION=+
MPARVNLYETCALTENSNATGGLHLLDEVQFLETPPRAQPVSAVANGTTSYPDNFDEYDEEGSPLDAVFKEQQMEGKYPSDGLSIANGVRAPPIPPAYTKVTKVDGRRVVDVFNWDGAAKLPQDYPPPTKSVNTNPQDPSRARDSSRAASVDDYTRLPADYVLSTTLNGERGSTPRLAEAAFSSSLTRREGTVSLREFNVERREAMVTRAEAEILGKEDNFAAEQEALHRRKAELAAKEQELRDWEADLVLWETEVITELASTRNVPVNEVTRQFGGMETISPGSSSQSTGGYYGFDRGDGTIDLSNTIP